MKIKTLSSICLSYLLERIDISDFDKLITNDEGVDFISILTLEENCHQLSCKALKKLLLYAASSQGDNNIGTKAINDKLNHIMNSVKRNQDVFSFFSDESVNLLQLNNYDLINRIEQSELNFVIEEGNHQDESMSFWLSARKKGQAILSAQDYRLAKFIDGNCLNHVIKDDH